VTLQDGHKGEDIYLKSSKGEKEGMRVVGDLAGQARESKFGGGKEFKVGDDKRKGFNRG